MSRLTRQAKTRAIVARLKGETSCKGCQYLYVFNTLDGSSFVNCSRNKNRKLRNVLLAPYDILSQVLKACQDGICELYYPHGDFFWRIINIYPRLNFPVGAPLDPLPRKTIKLHVEKTYDKTLS